MANSTPEAVEPGLIVRLEGAHNFREVGGLPTRDGRRLRRGLLWRSARLDDLTPGDIEIVRALGLEVIADLRRTSERAANPTAVRLLAGMRVLSWNLRQPHLDGAESGILKPGAEREHYFQAVLDLYRRIPHGQIVQVREIFEAIAEGALPILIHCSAGKDRTGVVVALILDVLGVPRERILHDYAESDRLIDWDRLTLAATAGTGVRDSWLNRLSLPARELLFRSDERYLLAALEHVEARYGSVIGFLTERAGVSRAVIDRVLDRMIEDQTARAACAQVE